jgi:hypothetical protein
LNFNAKNNHTTGYANRFKEMLKYLHKAGDDVEIFTADKDPNPPKEFLGLVQLDCVSFTSD